MSFQRLVLAPEFGGQAMGETRNWWNLWKGPGRVGFVKEFFEFSSEFGAKPQNPIRKEL